MRTKVAPFQPFNDKGSKISLGLGLWWFNVTFSYISIISVGRYVLLVEETRSNQRKPQTWWKSLKLVNCLLAQHAKLGNITQYYLYVKLYFAAWHVQIGNPPCIYWKEEWRNLTQGLTYYIMYISSNSNSRLSYYIK